MKLDDFMEVEPDEITGLYTSIHVKAAKPSPEQLDAKEVGTVRSTMRLAFWRF